MSRTGNLQPNTLTLSEAGMWERVLLGDKELFKKMTEPCLPTLLKAAQAGNTAGEKQRASARHAAAG
jgi:hypothetical protein